MPQDQDNDAQHGVEKLRELMRDVRIAMLTTVEPDGSLHSRPMALQHAEFDGDLWFFTDANSPKIHQIESEPHVNVSFSGDSTWVTASGTASLVTERAKIEKFWHEDLKAWFPQGTDTPGIGLIKVRVVRAEYWDTPSNAAVRVYGYLKGKLTGSSYQDEMTDHEKLTLK